MSTDAAAKGISITALYQQADGTTMSDFWSMAPYEPYIIDAGHMQAGDTLQFSLTNNTVCGGNIYVVRLNDDVYEQQMATLAAHQMDVTTYTDTRIEGTLTAPNDGAVFTSITYDAGWTVLVDGQKVETYPIGNAMLSFDVTAGEHTVTMTFFPRGFAIGLALSVLGLILLIAILWGLKHPERVKALTRRRSRSDEAAEPTEEPTEEPTAGSAVEQMEKWLDEQAEETPEEPADEAPEEPAEDNIEAILDEVLSADTREEDAE